MNSSATLCNYLPQSLPPTHIEHIVLLRCDPTDKTTLVVVHQHARMLELWPLIMAAINATVTSPERCWRPLRRLPNVPHNTGWSTRLDQSLQVDQTSNHSKQHFCTYVQTF
jgi:hypothetical protein